MKMCYVAGKIKGHLKQALKDWRDVSCEDMKIWKHIGFSGQEWRENMAWGQN